MPVNNRTMCKRNRIKDLNTGLRTVFCCCENVAINYYKGSKWGLLLWCQRKNLKEPLVKRFFLNDSFLSVKNILIISRTIHGKIDITMDVKGH